ncbi:NO signaling/Golgi transport ligand-binding domain-containing protein [Protomyces lactucae-debilis]|uniref:NO signaling/Golgi transport ligand-binding domain-containing protein n=1 Tax=Protomyces lactucae-debilis TaxID=2754530 RepID=A0A1Y2FQ89_PROLT|nr:NO signaling/Golgi transport ligand-binding domain-containing protein [Protomyces lactucae-debilis]ORY86099.1 NO signaling/Golgi transport ligand-binding domain-containing protein [Protomyces lactucae-debilis]
MAEIRPKLVNGSLQELLMIEMMAMTHRLTDAQLARPVLDVAVRVAAAEPQEQNDDTVSSIAPASVPMDTDVAALARQDEIEIKLEMCGYRLGHGLAERFSKDRPLLLDSLDCIKFLCKDLWMLLFSKQIDNLKTNHRGVYVLTDNKFRWFSKMSSRAGRPETDKLASLYLWFPCGMIRGALANLGRECTVVAESPNGVPSITFQIKMLAKEE